MHGSIVKEYLEIVERDQLQRDEVQLHVLERLEKLRQELTQVSRQKSHFFSRWFTSPPSVQGVYLWGGVGRGKTFIMDLFFEALPIEAKLRTHFHRFMRRVHTDLTDLKGTKNPLVQVAERLAKEAQVICFDEFFVSDITDAMILGGLLKELFARNVVLVATSNIVPRGLYKDGLQRSRFIPAIDLLESHMDVFNVDAGIDYRLRALTQAHTYYTPLGESSEKALEGCFVRLLPDAKAPVGQSAIEIEGRYIPVRKHAEDIIWFDFKALCDGPRSQNDYIELAREFHAVIVSNVPQLGRQTDDQARRFINMVDEFYDRRVKLILSASNPLDTLYGGGSLEFEFERTVSRLREMQSEEYLALAHRP